MNKVQKSYALAKAAYEAAEEAVKDFERDWIKAHGLRNPDGSIPEHFWGYDAETEEEWDCLCEQCGKDGANKLCEERETLRKMLIYSEDKLIDWGLGLPGVPTNIRETLKRNRKEYKIRKKLIDTVFRVDA